MQPKETRQCPVHRRQTGCVTTPPYPSRRSWPIKTANGSRMYLDTKDITSDKSFRDSMQLARQFSSPNSSSYVNRDVTYPAQPLGWHLPMHCPPL